MVINRVLILFIAVLIAVVAVCPGSDAAIDSPPAVYLNGFPGRLIVDKPEVGFPIFILGGQWADKPFELYVFTGGTHSSYTGPDFLWHPYTNTDQIQPLIFTGMPTGVPDYTIGPLPEFVNFEWPNAFPDASVLPNGDTVLTLCIDIKMDGHLTLTPEESECGSVTIQYDKPVCTLTAPANKQISLSTIYQGDNPPPSYISVGDNCQSNFFNASITSGGDWIKSASYDTFNHQIILAYDATSLKIGEHTGTVQLESSGGASDHLSVVLNVTAKPACTALSATPTQVNLTGVKNGGMFPGVTVSGSPAYIIVKDCNGNIPSQFTAAPDAQSNGWLSASRNPADGRLKISADGSKLSGTGTFRGTVTVTSSGATVAIPVNLVVSGNVVEPVCNISLWPSSLSFSGAAGSTTSTQHVAINDTCGNTNSFSAYSSRDWIKVTPATGSDSFNVYVDPMPAQTDSGTITVTIRGITYMLNVSATLTGPPTCTPGVKLSQSEVNLTLNVGSNAPTQTVSVQSVAADCTKTNVAYSYLVSDPLPSWMTVTPASPAAAGVPMSIAFTTNSLAANTYTTSIVVTPTGSAPLTLPVRIILQPEAPPNVTPLTSGVTMRAESLGPHSSRIYSARKTYATGSIAFGTATRDWATTIDMLVMYSPDCGNRLPNYNDYMAAKALGLVSPHEGITINGKTFYWSMDSSNQGILAVPAAAGCYYVYEYNTDADTGWYDLIYTDIP